MIAVDVMGGDYAPVAILEGALAAAQKGVSLLLCGDLDIIQPWLDRHDSKWPSYQIALMHAPIIIDMGEDPVASVRKKRESSLVKAVEAVASGRCNAVLSAGSSGALMVASIFILGKQEGIERPAIAGFLPSLHGNVLLLDLGANTDCRPQHLCQFAQMGIDYLHQNGLQAPRIALLSNGHEEGKGSLLVKETYTLLKNNSMINFIGNAEPCDIVSHKADIIVCDGFAGNILLKTMESVVDAITGWVCENDTLIIQRRFAHKVFGGAVLLGIKGSVIVCHGNSDGRTIERALMTACGISNRKNNQN